MKIGLEVHVQLTTQSKLFCGCANKFTDKPNTQTCDYCLGLPGSRPRLNEKAVEQAIRIGASLGCSFPKESFFSRKTYFYPDMGKNFQTTQYEAPIAENGFLTVGNRKIKISRVHLEEDPARIVHVKVYDGAGRPSGSVTDASYVLLDYNRSGVPLCEIVTEPEFTTSKEAKFFLQNLSSILQYLGVYDPSLEGSMRVDVNISVSDKRVEIKNISGFKEVEKAIEYEMFRQKDEKHVKRETRMWDADANATRPMRKKETEEDYGYIFEADLPRITLTKEKIQKIKKNLPEMAEDKLERYVKKLKIGYDLASAITNDPVTAEMFEEVIKKADRQLAARWFAGEIRKTLNYNSITLRNTELKAHHIINLLNMVTNKKITEATAEMILREMICHREPDTLLKKENVERIYDEDVLEPMVKEVMDENPNAIINYKSGKSEAINFLVGCVMKKTMGRGDFETIRRILKKYLK